MRRSPRLNACAALGVAVCTMAPGAAAEKVLIYDENKGIIFVDREGAVAGSTKVAAKVPAVGETTTTVTKVVRKSRHDIHVDRRKDPPGLYFESGLQYYQDEDYENALKNLQYAADRDPRKAEYRLWIAKTYRQLNMDEKMLQVLEELIRTFPESDVADDALFEIAFYHQKNDNYDSAYNAYARLAEQYPFGVSFAGGEEFREISQNQRRRMRAEMLSTLRAMGYKGDDLEEAFSDFQKANRLEITGTGKRETVRAIKDLQKKKAEEDARSSAEQETLREQSKYVGILGAGLFLNLLGLFAIRAKAARMRRHIVTLYSTIKELDPKSI